MELSQRDKDRVSQLANMIYESMCARFDAYHNAHVVCGGERVSSIVANIPNVDIGEYIGYHSSVPIYIVNELIIMLKDRQWLTVGYNLRAGVLQCKYTPSSFVNFNSLTELKQCQVLGIDTITNDD